VRNSWLQSFLEAVSGKAFKPITTREEKEIKLYSLHPGWHLFFLLWRSGCSAGTAWCVHASWPLWSENRPSSFSFCPLKLSHSHSDQGMSITSEDWIMTNLEGNGNFKNLKRVLSNFPSYFYTSRMQKGNHWHALDFDWIALKMKWLSVFPRQWLVCVVESVLVPPEDPPLAIIDIHIGKTLSELNKWMPAQIKLPGGRDSDKKERIEKMKAGSPLTNHLE